MLPFTLPRADALAVLREIDLVLVSLHRIASDDRAREGGGVRGTPGREISPAGISRVTSEGSIMGS